MTEALAVLGYAVVLLGGVLSVIGSVGLIRFPSFFVRIHAATVAVIGGSVIPLVGVAILSYALHGSDGVVTSLGALGTAAFIFLTAPVSSHAIARAATKMKISREPMTEDHLEEDGR